MSSSSLSSPPSSNNSLDTAYTAEERLRIALEVVDDMPHSEHHVVRYSMILLEQYFSSNTWNNVPQYYTQNGRWPDLALELYIRRPGQKRDRLFVPRVFV
jgi:hypothetical protein